MDILQQIVETKKAELQQAKDLLPPRRLYAQVESLIQSGDAVPSMRDALLASPSGIIAEFKRRSPSKGWIRQQGRPDDIPLQYQDNGASAISILTDTQYFGGEDRFITVARQSGVTIPVLYKNFVIDEYQVFQARNCGASAVLLIAADLTIGECRTLMRTAHELQLEVLLEMHSAAELDYAALEPDMYGINNRNLGSFVTDVQNSLDMAALLPEDKCLVSESGISNPDTVSALRAAGYRGFLIGEHFMRADKPGLALRQFIELIS